MANSVIETVIRGPVHYAKILGSPVPCYDKDKGKEWKMDVELNAATVKELKGYGIGDRIKQKDGYLDGAPHISLRQNSQKADGTPNNSPRVVEGDGKTPWDQEKLIGNESVCDVKVAIMDHGPGKKKGVYIRGVRVLKHVPYEGTLFSPLDEDDEYFAGGDDDIAEKPQTKRGKTKISDELDDEIPF